MGMSYKSARNLRPRPCESFSPHWHRKGKHLQASRHCGEAASSFEGLITYDASDGSTYNKALGFGISGLVASRGRKHLSLKPEVWFLEFTFNRTLQGAAQFHAGNSTA